MMPSAFDIRRSAVVLSLLFVAGCQALKVERAGIVSPSDWLTEGDAAERSNAVAAVLDPPLEQVWKYNAGGGFGPLSPLILGDVVLVGTRKGEVHAVDLATGKKRGQTGFGDAIEGTPAVGDGVLYVPVGWGGRALQAYDLIRARTLWKARSAPVEAGLLLRDETVVAADLEGFVRAYDRDKGTVVWEYRVGERVGVQAAPVAAGDDQVVVADDGGTVTALDAGSGSVRWTRRLRAPVQVTPVSGDGVVFLSTTRGRLVALDAARGTVRWTYQVPDTAVYLAAPALAGGTVVFGASDAVVRAVDAATGAERWAQRVEGAVTAPVLLTDGTVYAGTMNNRLVALDRATGDVRWTHELDGRVKSPLAFKDGHLVVLSEPRTVYLFKHGTSGYATN